MNARAIAAIVLLMSLAACGDDEVGGTYQLVSVEGESLPFEASANGETDWHITGGSLEVSSGSIEWTEDFEAPEGDGGFHFFSEHDYSEEDGVLTTEPEAVDPVPDDLFVVCETGGIYRIEDDGDQLRMIDVVQDGECDAPSQYQVLERVYRRD